MATVTTACGALPVYDRTPDYCLLADDYDDDALTSGVINPVPLPQLDQPQNLASSAITDTTATVSWDAVDNATGYRVNYAPGGKEKTVTDPTIDLTGLTASTKYTVTVIATADGYADSKPSTVQFTTTAPPAPTITSLNPATGAAAGGTAVTITGTGFTGATGVTFGGTAGTSFSVTNATTIAVTTPAGSAGAVDVVVQSPNGNATKTGAFTYS